MSREETRTESTGSDSKANPGRENGASRSQQQPENTSHRTQTRQSRGSVGQPPGHGSPTHRTDADESNFFLLSLSLGILGVILLWNGFQLYSVGNAMASYGVESSLQTLGLVLAGVGLAELLAAYGLWTLQPWGWKASAGALALGALLSLYAASQAGSSGLFGVLVHGGLLGYLYTKRSLFRKLTAGRGTGFGSTASRHHNYTNQNTSRSSSNGRTDW